MRTAAMELAPRGITISAVLPGNVFTEGLADLGQDYLDEMTASIPQRRLGTPADIGNAALFLATGEAGYRDVGQCAALQIRAVVKAHAGGPS